MTRLKLAALGVLLSATVAHADSAVSERARIEGSVGLKSPLGAGVEVDGAITSWLSVGAGVGYAFSANGFGYNVGLYRDLQLAAMARAHAPLERIGLEVGGGVGLSMGGYRRFDVPVETVTTDDGTQEWDRAKWANVELSAQTRGRLYVRGFAGAGLLLNGDDCRNYHGVACMQSTPLGRGYGGIGVGYRM